MMLEGEIKFVPLFLFIKFKKEESNNTYIFSFLLKKSFKLKSNIISLR